MIINTQKINFILFSALLIFLAGIILVVAYTQQIPNPGHGADQIWISINGTEKTLQQAIDDKTFPCYFSGGFLTKQISRGHSGGNIIVNIGGKTQTLQKAINSHNLSKSMAGRSPALYHENQGMHSADQIWISINGTEKTLQQAINNGNFYCPSQPPPQQCQDTSWTPDPSTICQGQSFTQTSNCGNTRTATGTKYCPPAECQDTSWTPEIWEICEGQIFTQTSNCGNTRTATGTKDCSCQDTSLTPDPSTICQGQEFTQTSNCGNTRTATGTKLCYYEVSCEAIGYWSECSVVCNAGDIREDLTGYTKERWKGVYDWSVSDWDTFDFEKWCTIISDIFVGGAKVATVKADTWDAGDFDHDCRLVAKCRISGT